MGSVELCESTPGQVPANTENNCAKNSETGEELARGEDTDLSACAYENLLFLKINLSIHFSSQYLSPLSSQSLPSLAAPPSFFKNRLGMNPGCYSCSTGALRLSHVHSPPLGDSRQGSTPESRPQLFHF